MLFWVRIANIMACQQTQCIIIMSAACIEKTELCADVYRIRNGRFVKCMLSSEMRNKFSQQSTGTLRKLRSVYKKKNEKENGIKNETNIENIFERDVPVAIIPSTVARNHKSITPRDRRGFIKLTLLRYVL